jgi:hypothetical protein
MNSTADGVSSAAMSPKTYMDNADNFCLFDLNTIANYAPDIVEFVDVPAPCAFERDKHGRWTAVTPTFEA